MPLAAHKELMREKMEQSMYSETDVKLNEVENVINSAQTQTFTRLGLSTTDK